MKDALIVWGGWMGHEPDKVSALFSKVLKEEGFNVEVSDTLDAFLDEEKLAALTLIIPVWTMGKITGEQLMPVVKAVAGGTGLAGCHGGMCDSFRDSVTWQFMTGGNWVEHPGGGQVEYTVNVKKGSSPITEGISDFKLVSEQYYMHVDPAVQVLATTRFPTFNYYHASNGPVDVPVAWTKRWGHGRVFYNSVGHSASCFDGKDSLEMMKRGMLWAAEGKEIAVAQGLDRKVFEDKAFINL